MGGDHRDRVSRIRDGIAWNSQGKALHRHEAHGEGIARLCVAPQGEGMAPERFAKALHSNDRKAWQRISTERRGPDWQSKGTAWISIEQHRRAMAESSLDWNSEGMAKR